MAANLNVVPVTGNATPAPTDKTWGEIRQMVGRSIRRAVYEIASRPGVLILFVLGLVAAMMGGWQYSGEAAVSLTSIAMMVKWVMAYIAGSVLLAYVGGMLAEFLPEPDEGRTVFILLSIVNYMASAYVGFMVFKGLEPSMGYGLALGGAAVTALFFSTWWLVLKIMITEKVDFKQALAVPLMVVVGIVLALTVEVPAAFNFGGKSASATQNVRAAVNLVATAIDRATQRVQIRTGMVGTLEAQISVLNGRIKEEETPSVGALSRKLTAERDNLNASLGSLKTVVGTQTSAITALGGRLAVVNKLLTDGGEFDTDKALAELIAVQSAANGIINEAPELGVRGVLNNLAAAMKSELAVENISKGRKGKIDAHVAALTGIQSNLEPIVVQAEGIKPVTERPKSRGTLEVLGDTWNTTEALNFAAEGIRIVFFVLVSFFTWLAWAAYYRPSTAGKTPEQIAEINARVQARQDFISTWLRRVVKLILWGVVAAIGWFVYQHWGTQIYGFIQWAMTQGQALLAAKPQ
ncbi:MAG: hypothetical protein WAX89_02695 [Alphaproteobacteria bacterium]